MLCRCLFIFPKSMKKPYVPFGEEWEREIKKLSVRQLELVFDLEANGLKKSEFIEVIKKSVKLKSDD